MVSGLMSLSSMRWFRRFELASAGTPGSAVFTSIRGITVDYTQITLSVIKKDVF